GAASRSVAPVPRDAPWPAGDRAVAPADWGPSVDATALTRVIDAAFEGAGDPAAANARGLAVVHRGRLLVDRGAPGFAPGTPLHGWSMTKTVVGMLAHQLAAEGRLVLAAPVVDALPEGRAPAWRDAWRTDARARIAVEDLVHMRDGLGNDEDYAPGGSVTRMLYGHRDVAGFAASAPAQAAPGERWRYLSASTNLLSRTLRARVATDAEHWTMPRRVVFDPIGARTAVMETDADGTWIGSSYLWASTADWARLGELTLRDGRWQGTQVLAPGWLVRASRPATPSGPGRMYGGQTWRIGDPQAGLCRGRGVPEDAIAMSGHWGQLVAIVPSREAVIVRMGWTFDRTKFDGCALVAQVLGALR
ncbi:MAG: serine hydrolase domain-containing protein, partial [Burkholderiaceae bacterium]